MHKTWMPLVEGESAFAIVRVLKRLEFDPPHNGLTRFHLSAPTEEIGPLRRAYERVERRFAESDEAGLDRATRVQG
jgi:hypothetical protein